MSELCLKMYEIVFYDYDERIIEEVASRKVFTNAICFLHNQDITENGEPKKAHYHLFVKLNTSTVISKVSDWLSIPTNYFERIKGRFNDCVLYGFHKNAPNKFQYGADAVIYSKNVDYLSILNSSFSKADFENYLIQLSNGSISYETFVKKVPIEFQLKSYQTILNARKLNLQNTSFTNRNIKVYYICGSSGSGKTTLAKYLCDKKNISYYVSSSGENLFDDYNYQRAVILDDFRASQMRFSDLLKLLDNNTSSFVKARYCNKAPLYDYIIITSVFAPNELYSFDTLGGEPLLQFYRRISKLLFIKDNSAIPFKLSPSGSDFVSCGDSLFNMNEVISYFSSKNVEVEDLF